MMQRIGPFLLLSFLCLLLYAPGIATVPMMDRDSAHFAQATKQMMQANNYFQIRFQDKTRYQKPPGINWLQAMSVKLFSDENASKAWPYRIPSLLGGLFSVLLLYVFARRFLSGQLALMASGLFASTLLLTVESHLAVIDSSLLSSVVLMQGALWVIYDATRKQKIPHWAWALLFWLAMGYGFALKGVTPLVGFLTIATLCVVDKEYRWLKALRFHWGLPVFILSMTWLVFVNEAEQSNYLLKMVQKDLLPKLQGGHESHGQAPLFHLAILPLTFWPASLFLWQAFICGWENRRTQEVKFMLAWCLPTWVFFELMPTKLPQYVLPTFPAIAILAAIAINSSEQMIFRGKKLLWFRFLLIVWLIFSMALASVFLIIPWTLWGKLNGVGIGIFAVMSLTALIATRFSWQQKYKRAAWVVILGAVLSYGPIYQVFLPSLKPLWLSNQVVDSLGAQRIASLSSTSPLLVIGYEEPSLVFNLNTTKVKFTSVSHALQRVLGRSARFIVVDKKNKEALVSALTSEGLSFKVIKQVQGINYNKGKQVQLILVEVINE